MVYKMVHALSNPASCCTVNMWTLNDVLVFIVVRVASSLECKCVIHEC